MRNQNLPGVTIIRDTTDTRLTGDLGDVTSAGCTVPVCFYWVLQACVSDSSGNRPVKMKLLQDDIVATAVYIITTKPRATPNSAEQNLATGLYYL